MRVAERLIRLAGRGLPPRLAAWSEAMAREAAVIERPGAALVFALGCIGWAAREGLVVALRDALSRDNEPTEENRSMISPSTWPSRDVALGCAIGATGLGLAYLAAAGAPGRLMTMNVAALIAGLVMVLPFSRREPVEKPFAGATAVVIGLILLFTAGAGVETAGARRWFSVGGVVLQPSLILLPLLIVSFARSRDVLTAAGVALAAAALAWQPDRAMAATLVAGIGVVALVHRERLAVAAFLVAAAGLAVAWIQPDVVPATPFVDQVFRTAFSVSPAAGLAVWGGAAILLAPAVLGMWKDRADGAVHAAFGAAWLAIIVAAVVGDYPTPLVGYGGSAIVGYLLATMALPRRGAQAPKLFRSGPRRIEAGEAGDRRVASMRP